MPKSAIKVYRNIIEHWGMELVHRARIRTVLDDQTVEDSWAEDRAFKGHLTQLTGYLELYERLGLSINADFILDVYPEEPINVGDLIIIDIDTVNEEQAEVIEMVKRRTGNVIEVKELLLKKRG